MFNCNPSWQSSAAAPRSSRTARVRRYENTFPLFSVGHIEPEEYTQDCSPQANNGQHSSCGMPLLPEVTDMVWAEHLNALDIIAGDRRDDRRYRIEMDLGWKLMRSWEALPSWYRHGHRFFEWRHSIQRRTTAASWKENRVGHRLASLTEFHHSHAVDRLWPHRSVAGIPGRRAD